MAKPQPPSAIIRQVERDLITRYGLNTTGKKTSMLTKAERAQLFDRALGAYAAPPADPSARQPSVPGITVLDDRMTWVLEAERDTLLEMELFSELDETATMDALIADADRRARDYEARKLFGDYLAAIS